MVFKYIIHKIIGLTDRNKEESVRRNNANLTQFNDFLKTLLGNVNL